MRSIATLLIGMLLLAGCEEPPSLPPPTSRPGEATPETDHVHSVLIHADRQIVIPNLLFVLQRDSADGIAGLTLLSSRPAPDGSRLVFGTSQNVPSQDRLTGLELRFGGASLFDPHGNGIFTATAAYQPKFATIAITKVADDEVSGTIRGEFHRFRALQGGGRGDAIQLEGKFRAALVVR